jgi:hypothetical protein
VNDAPHSTIGPASGAPPALPVGWRNADSVRFTDAEPRVPGIRRWIIALVVIALLLVEAIGAAAWIAQSHYSRGRAALQIGAFATAADEFGRARLLWLPYRDANSLGQSARRSLDQAVARHQADAARRGAALAQLQQASARLKAQDGQGVVVAVRTADARGLQDVAAASFDVRRAVNALAADVAKAAQAALAARAWDRGHALLTALLILDPKNADLGALGKQAHLGDRLRADLEAARRAAQRRHWRAALRLALAVLAADKGFPGAADVAARARVALAPKPKPSATASSAVAPATVAPPTTTSTPPQPPPP